MKRDPLEQSCVLTWQILHMYLKLSTCLSGWLNWSLTTEPQEDTALEFTRWLLIKNPNLKQSFKLKTTDA